MSKVIQLSIVLGRTHRPDIAIADFWQRARSAVEGLAVSIDCTAIYVADSDRGEEISHDGLKVVRLDISDNGRLSNFADRSVTKAGPLGVLARLAAYNLASRAVAHAVAADAELATAICTSDVIVAADPEADRAIWKLRRRTDAKLLHGPFAMANALAELAQQ